MDKNRALFLDRDGTLIRDCHYLSDPDKVEVISGVGESLKKASHAGFLLFLHTNQSGIARGYYDWSQVHACNQRMFRELNLTEGFFSQICIAPEDPEEIGGNRKPSANFELEMIAKFNLNPKDCWVVGDKWIDPQTGLNAGMKGALVESLKSIDNDLRRKALEKEILGLPDLSVFIRKEILDER